MQNFGLWSPGLSYRSYILGVSKQASALLRTRMTVPAPFDGHRKTPGLAITVSSSVDLSMTLDLASGFQTQKPVQQLPSAKKSWIWVMYSYLSKVWRAPSRIPIAFWNHSRVLSKSCGGPLHSTLLEAGSWFCTQVVGWKFQPPDLKVYLDWILLRGKNRRKRRFHRFNSCCSPHQLQHMAFQSWIKAVIFAGP